MFPSRPAVVNPPASSCRSAWPGSPALPAVNRPRIFFSAGRRRAPGRGGLSHSNPTLHSQVGRCGGPTACPSLHVWPFAVILPSAAWAVVPLPRSGAGRASGRSLLFGGSGSSSYSTCPPAATVLPRCARRYPPLGRLGRRRALGLVAHLSRKSPAGFKSASCPPRPGTTHAHSPLSPSRSSTRRMVRPAGGGPRDARPRLMQKSKSPPGGRSRQHANPAHVSGIARPLFAPRAPPAPHGREPAGAEAGAQPKQFFPLAGGCESRRVHARWCATRPSRGVRVSRAERGRRGRTRNRRAGWVLGVVRHLVAAALIARMRPGVLPAFSPINKRCRASTRCVASKARCGARVPRGRPHRQWSATPPRRGGGEAPVAMRPGPWARGNEP